MVILTLRTGTVEVFEHRWGDSPSHPLGCQGKILEAIKGVRGHGSGDGERPGEDGECQKGTCPFFAFEASLSKLLFRCLQTS